MTLELAINLATLLVVAFHAGGSWYLLHDLKARVEKLEDWRLTSASD